MSHKIKIDRTMPKPRNAMAVVARRMRASSFDHKAEVRGGTTNEQVELMAEYTEFLLDCDQDDESDC